jgi:hypothetical protein
VRTASILLSAMLVGCGFSLTPGAAPGDARTDGTSDDGDAATDAAIDGVVPEWAFRRKLTINNTGLGAHSSLAVLVMLDPLRITYGATKPMGADLRFTDINGNLLAYEIERWEQGATSIAWVNVPSIAAGSTPTELWMLYGNPNAVDAQRPADVWDANYVGVWHFADATDSSASVTSLNMGATGTAGPIGRAFAFNGTNQYVDTGTTEHLTRWTIEMWLRPATVAAANGASSPVSRFPNYMLLWSCNGVNFCQKVMYDGTAGFTHNVGYAPPVNQWSHVVGRFTGTALESFVGGTRVGQEMTTDTPLTTTFSAKIGTRMDLAGYFNGAIDEVRISRTGRSLDYISAHYRSTSDTFLTYGPEIQN